VKNLVQHTSPTDSEVKRKVLPLVPLAWTILTIEVGEGKRCRWEKRKREDYKRPIVSGEQLTLMEGDGRRDENCTIGSLSNGLRALTLISWHHRQTRLDTAEECFRQKDSNATLSMANHSRRLCPSS
jgi:hypothetical protein